MVLFELMFPQTRGVVYFFISQMNFLLFLFPTSIIGGLEFGVYLIYIYNKLLRYLTQNQVLKLLSAYFFCMKLEQDKKHPVISSSTSYPFLPFKHFIHCTVEHTCQEDLYLRIQSSSAASATITSLKWSKNETNCSYLFWIMHPTTYLVSYPKENK